MEEIKRIEMWLSLTKQSINHTLQLTLSDNDTKKILLEGLESLDRLNMAEDVLKELKEKLPF